MRQSGRTTASRTAMVGAAVALLGACASQEPPQLSGLEGTSGPSMAMEKGEVAGRTALVWRAPNADMRRYTRVIIDPVDVYRGADADYGGADVQQQQQLADYMRGEFSRAIGRWAAVAPGPGVARLKLTLAGLENNTPVVAPVSRVAPAGLVLNLGKQVMDQPGSFTGGVTIAGQLSDSVTDQPLVTFVQKRYPEAMNISATFSSRDAQEAAIRQAAEAFKARLEELQAGRK